MEVYRPVVPFVRNRECALEFLKRDGLFVRVDSDLKFITDVLEEDFFLDDRIETDVAFCRALMENVDTKRSHDMELMLLVGVPTVAIKTEIKVGASLAHEPISLNRLHAA